MKFVSRVAKVSLLVCPYLLFSYEVQPSSLTLRHIESGGVGYNVGYTTLQGFLTQDPNVWEATPFVDIRGHILNNGTWAANAGGGVRGLFKDRIYGINAFYDYRGTSLLSYNQASIGLETLGKMFDTRINAYLPFGQKVSKGYSTKFNNFYDHYMRISRKKEYAMKGGNVEFGFNFGSCSKWRTYAAFGPYFFHGKLGANAWGGKVRLKASYKQYVALEIMNSYDNVFHNHFQGQIYFSIPFGRKKKKTDKPSRFSKQLYCRMSDPVEKNEIIVLNRSREYAKGLNSDGNPYYFMFMNNTSASNGSFESPYHSLEQLQNNSGPGQILYVYPGDGTTKNMDKGIILQDNQSLWGSSLSYNVNTQYGPVVIPPSGNTLPKITNDQGGQGVTLAQNNSVLGFHISVDQGIAIYGNEPSSVTISDCVLDSCGYGTNSPMNFYIGSPSTLNIYRNLFTNNTSGGIAVSLSPGAECNINFNDNTALNNLGINGLGESAILAVIANGEANQCIINAQNNNIIDSRHAGINVQSFNAGKIETLKLNVLSNNFSNIQVASALQIFADCKNCQLNVVDNTITNTRGGMYITGGQAPGEVIQSIQATITNNKFSQIQGERSVFFGGPNEQVSINLANNQITGGSSTGFEYTDPSNSPPQADLNVQITDNLISDNNQSSYGSGGVYIDSYKKLKLKMSDNTLSNNTGYGLTLSAFSSLPQENVVISLENNTFINNDNVRILSWSANPYSCCLYMKGNSCDANPSYFYIQGAGSTGQYFIAPIDYNSLNSGNFSFSTPNPTPASSCQGVECTLK